MGCKAMKREWFAAMDQITAGENLAGTSPEFLLNQFLIVYPEVKRARARVLIQRWLRQRLKGDYDGRD